MASSQQVHSLKSHILQHIWGNIFRYYMTPLLLKNESLTFCVKTKTLFFIKTMKSKHTEEGHFCCNWSVSIAPMTNCIMAYVSWSGCNESPFSTDVSVVKALVIEETFESWILVQSIFTCAAGREYPMLTRRDALWNSVSGFYSLNSHISRQFWRDNFSSIIWYHLCYENWRLGFLKRK